MKKATITLSFDEDKLWWLVILFYIGFQWTGAMKNGSMTFFCQWVLDNSFFTNLGMVENLGDAWGMPGGCPSPCWPSLVPSPWPWPLR